MADYFTKFSLVLPLPNEAAQAYALDLTNKAERLQRGEEVPGELPSSLMEVVEIWNFETATDNRDGKWELWLHGEFGGIDALCVFIQHLLQKFNPSGRVSFEWSNDCSKPRVDAYGGGAAIITAKKIKSMNTTEWLRKNAA
jgi:hypothetical protein